MKTLSALFILVLVLNAYSQDYRNFSKTIRVVNGQESNTVTYLCRYNLNKILHSNYAVYDTININTPAGYVVTDVNVIIDTVLHTWDSNLLFTINHLGIIDSIIVYRGGSGDNFIGTILNDSALMAISQGTPPFTGSFRPDKPLSKLNGLNPTGAWILRISNDFGGDTGILKAWCIQVSFTSSNGIQGNYDNIPERFELYQNYPNPFNPATKIKFAVPSPSLLKRAGVRLVIYDVLGREVQTLVNEQLQPGTYEVEWSATGGGSNYSSGVYYYTLTTGASASLSTGYTETRKMVLLK